MVDCVDMKPLHLSLIVCLLALQSCSLDERLSATSAKLENQYAEVRLWDELPLRTISWNQAVAMIKQSNLEYISTQKAIERANRDELSVYTDLIPGVSYYSYITKSLSDLTQEYNSNNISHNVNINFYLPTITRVPYRVYASKAAAFAAIKAQEGKERELISKLYALQRKRDISNRRKALEERKQEENSAAFQSLKKDNTQTEWSNIAALLGDYSARWVILPSSIPQFRWSNYRKLTGSLDSLVVCKLALELEQSRMRQYGVAINFLPTINTSLYSPSLFSSTGGTYSGTFLDMDDTQLNLSISYNFDTQLNVWNNYLDSKDDYEKKQREMVSRLVDYKQKLHSLRTSMDEYNTWKSYMHKQMEHLRSAPAANAEEFIQTETTLQSMEQELLTQEEAAVETEAALILQYGLR